MYVNVKNIFVITCIVGMLLFVSCGDKSQNSSDGYAIEATIQGVPDGVRAFLKISNEKGVPQPKDTAIVQNEKVVFKGKVDYPLQGFIYVNGTSGNINLLLENADLTVNAEKDRLPAAKVSGGKHNDDYTGFIEGSKVLADKTKKARELYQNAVTSKDAENTAKYRKEVADLDRETLEYQEKYVIDHPDSYISIVLVSRMLQNKLTTAQKSKQFIDQLPEDLKKTRVGQDLILKTSEILRSSIGSIAENFTAPDPDGKMVSLKDIRGKVTVIDFWAAWCGPCRRENPNLVKTYNKYHKDGLEIIGVSLDGTPNQQNPREAWLTAIKTDGLPWHQVSNLDGPRDAIARTYNIRTIPATFILNEKGEIVAKNLRGATLEAKVKELLGK